MPIVAARPPVEEMRPAHDLRLGDVILRDPDTDQPVRWHLLSDGTTHKHDRIWFLVGTGPGQYDGQRHISFGIAEQLRAEICPPGGRGRWTRPTTESEA